VLRRSHRESSKRKALKNEGYIQIFVPVDHPTKRRALPGSEKGALSPGWLAKRGVRARSLNNQKEQDKTVRYTLLKTVITLGGLIIMNQLVSAKTPDAAADPRIDPQVRGFLAELNKDSSPFGNCRNPSRRRF
jgi:hypothetical protein